MIINLTGFGDREAIRLTFGMSVDDAMWAFECDVDVPFGAAQAILEATGITGTIDLGYDVLSFVVERVSKSAAFGKGRKQCKLSARSLHREMSEPYCTAQTVTASGSPTVSAFLSSLATTYGYSGTVTYTGDSWTVADGTVTHDGSMLALAKDIAEASSCIIMPDPSTRDFAVSPRYPSLSSPYTTFDVDNVISDSVEYSIIPMFATAVVSGTVYPADVTVSLTGATGATVHMSNQYVHDAASGQALAYGTLVSKSIAYRLSFTTRHTPGLIQPGMVVAYDDAYALYTGVVHDISYSIEYGTQTISISLDVYTKAASTVSVSYRDPVTVSSPWSEASPLYTDGLPPWYIWDDTTLIDIDWGGGFDTPVFGIWDFELPGGGTVDIIGGDVSINWPDPTSDGWVIIIGDDGYGAPIYWQLDLYPIDELTVSSPWVISTGTYEPGLPVYTGWDGTSPIDIGWGGGIGTPIFEVWDFDLPTDGTADIVGGDLVLDWDTPTDDGWVIIHTTDPNGDDVYWQIDIELPGGDPLVGTLTAFGGNIQKTGLGANAANSKLLAGYLSASAAYGEAITVADWSAVTGPIPANTTIGDLSAGQAMSSISTTGKATGNRSGIGTTKYFVALNISDAGVVTESQQLGYYSSTYTAYCSGISGDGNVIITVNHLSNTAGRPLYFKVYLWNGSSYTYAAVNNTSLTFAGFPHLRSTITVNHDGSAFWFRHANQCHKFDVNTTTGACTYGYNATTALVSPAEAMLDQELVCIKTATGDYLLHSVNDVDQIDCIDADTLTVLHTYTRAASFGGDATLTHLRGAVVIGGVLYMAVGTTSDSYTAKIYTFDGSF